MFDKEKAQAEILARHYTQFPKQPTGPTGPRTEAGKQGTRFNAYKHGLTGQIHLFTAEEHQAFEEHCQSIVQALAPVGTLERQLAQSIAEDRWRLNRARALESGIFALDFASWEFVFSSAEIDTLISRRQRLDAAHALCAMGLPACRPSQMPTAA